jgi:hypothetical protein
MSLIEEALRQLEAKHTASKPSPAPAPPSPAASPPAVEPSPLTMTTSSGAPVLPSPTRPEEDAAPPGINPWMGFVATLAGCAVLLLVGLTLGVAWQARSPQLQAPPPAAPMVVTPVDPPVVAPVKALPRPRPILASPKPPSLELNGIVEGVGEPLVIVNGHLLRRGESIDGATLMEVRDNAARFQWRDEDLIIRTTH